MRDAYGASAEANELVQQLFQAFNSRDIETALTLLHRDVVFEPISAVVLNEGQPYLGHEGIRLYFEHVSKHWRKLEVNPIQIRAAGMAVVALGQTSGVGPGGSLVAAPTTWLFKFRDGLVAELQIFSDERLARRALAAVENTSPA